MKPKTVKTFAAKILLFGEHAVLKGSQALAVPYPKYNGFFAKYEGAGSSQQQASAKALKIYLGYLENHLKPHINTRILEEDIYNNWYFESSIPNGYGLGSSGALVAAVYDRYKLHKDKEWQALKPIFAKMESHFHGKSSGLDPLISYLNQPVLVTKEGLLPKDLPDYTNGNAAIFLLNTRKPRQTGPLVKEFLQSCEKQTFLDKIEKQLIPNNEKLINSFLTGNGLELMEAWKDISDFQWKHFQAMIPEETKALWKEGLNSADYWLKVCGAGGGGYMLGICKDIKGMQSKLTARNTEVVFRFQHS